MNRPRPRTSPTCGSSAEAAREPVEQRGRRGVPTAPRAGRGASRRSRPVRRRGSRRCRGTSTCACRATSAPSSRPADDRRHAPARHRCPCRPSSGRARRPSARPPRVRPVRPKPHWISSKTSRTPWRVAQAAQPGEEAVGRDDDAAVALDRLDDDRRQAARCPTPGPPAPARTSSSAAAPASGAAEPGGQRYGSGNGQEMGFGIPRRRASRNADLPLSPTTPPARPK